MLKNILELEGAQKMSKSEQRTINGGGCVMTAITADIYGPYNGGVYASHTAHYDCGNGPQTGPMHIIPME